MASISGISGASAWALQDSMRARQQPMQDRLFAHADADGSGGVDATELASVLQTAADRAGITLETSAEDLLAGADGDGDGSLSSGELGDVLRSTLQPPSTMAFAESRNAQNTGARQSGTSAAAFSDLDTDGDGVLSQTEFEADRSTDMRPPMGGPRGPGGPRNPDEAAQSDAVDALQSLLTVADADGDQTLSSSEAQTLVGRIAEALQSLETTGSTASDTEEGNGTGIDFVALAELVRKQYEQSSSTVSSTGSTVDTSA